MAVVKRLLIQGATGSIGKSVIDVVRRHRDRFSVAGLAAHSSSKALSDLAGEFGVSSVALSDKSAMKDLRVAVGRTQVFTGPSAAEEQAEELDYDLLVNAMTGSAGLEPTARALERGIPVALANKETLVAAGPIIMELARQNDTHVIPIDSEHSAIFQCLIGEAPQAVRAVWLTTSGGPFWGTAWSSLDKVTPAQALAHPTWKMGPKITVDSATLFNKGLEVIEAARLFGITPECIRVICHRQSIVHSMVEFIDGSFKAQLSIPDMRLPVLYALTYPERIPSELVQTPPDRLSHLTFDSLHDGDFPCLDLAFDALKKGGTAPAALSAADEIAVDAFLSGRIGFTSIPKILSAVVAAWPDEPLTDLAAARAADHRARRLASHAVAERIEQGKEGTPC